EAAILIVLVRLSFHVTTFAATRRLLARVWPPRAPRESDAAEAVSAARVGAGVRAAARRLPDTTCLVEALVADVMLRRRGVETVLHIGVRAPSAAAALDAHAWLECHGTVVVGDADNLGEYRILTKPS